MQRASGCGASCTARCNMRQPRTAAFTTSRGRQCDSANGKEVATGQRTRCSAPAFRASSAPTSRSPASSSCSMVGLPVLSGCRCRPCKSRSTCVAAACKRGRDFSEGVDTPDGTQTPGSPGCLARAPCCSIDTSCFYGQLQAWLRYGKYSRNSRSSQRHCTRNITQCVAT